MRIGFLLTIILTTLPASLVTAAAPPDSTSGSSSAAYVLPPGWLSLFDGQTLFGWSPNSSTTWKVEDGSIVGSGETPGLLVSHVRFSDYMFRCEAKFAEGANSGLFLRTAFTPKNPAVDCFELNFCDQHPAGFTTGSLVGRQKTEAPIVAAGKWHLWEARVQGARVQVWLDGTQVLDHTDESTPQLTAGFIGLQMNGGQAEFRNIAIQPLGFESLFDGKSLAGWHVVPGSAGEFRVVDNTIEVTGGRGFLETEATAADFVLQFDAITLGKDLNSGVFFRAIKGTAEAPSHGYEFQIHHGFKEGDRTKPVDHGTGAIFRRQSAKRIVGQDKVWFTGTLVADGPRMMTWVDGIPVVAWTDERPPNTNPREGLRTEAGHFSVQAHDPTTKLQFKNIKLIRLPESR